MDAELRTVSPPRASPSRSASPAEVGVLGREAGVAVEQEHDPRRRRPPGRVDRAPGGELAPQPACSSRDWRSCSVAVVTAPTPGSPPARPARRRQSIAYTCSGVGRASAARARASAAPSSYRCRRSRRGAGCRRSGSSRPDTGPGTRGRRRARRGRRGGPHRRGAAPELQQPVERDLLGGGGSHGRRAGGAGGGVLGGGDKTRRWESAAVWRPSSLGRPRVAGCGRGERQDRDRAAGPPGVTPLTRAVWAGTGRRARADLCAAWLGAPGSSPRPASRSHRLSPAASAPAGRCAGSCWRGSSRCGARRPLGREHQVHAEGAAPLGDPDERGDEIGWLGGERGELVDDDQQARDRQPARAAGPGRQLSRGRAGRPR